jgi:hypothetical protein
MYNPLCYFVYQTEPPRIFSEEELADPDFSKTYFPEDIRWLDDLHGGLSAFIIPRYPGGVKRCLGGGYFTICENRKSVCKQFGLRLSVPRSACSLQYVVFRAKLNDGGSVYDLKREDDVAPYIMETSSGNLYRSHW